MLQGLRIVFFILFFPLQKFCSEAYVGENVKSLVLSELQKFCAAVFFSFPVWLVQMMFGVCCIVIIESI